MNFDFSDELKALRDQARKFLRERDAAAWEIPRSIAASVKLPASAIATRQRS